MFINRASKEINLRVVYAGLPGSGKVESLRALYDRFPAEAKGKMITVAHPRQDRARATVFFDVVPPGLGKIRDFRIRLHLYVLSGEQETDEDVRLLLKNVDGLVFVANGRQDRRGAETALQAVKVALRQQSLQWEGTPVVFQLEGATNALRRSLGVGQRPSVEANPQAGVGVFEALKALTKELLVAFGEDRLREWVETPEEKVRGDAFLARAQIIGHCSEFFGEPVDEYEPRAVPMGVPFYVISVHQPTPARPYFTYVTAGFSTTSAPGGGHRIELIAYTPALDEAAIDALAAAGRMLAESDPDGPPWKVFDTVDLGETGLRDRWFVLAPVTFLQLVPVTADEIELAQKHGSRELLGKLEHRERGFGWGRSRDQSVLRPE